jgi:GalNAc5-diNAcBac-PP-undecaprenol beta-1,3-glucosyltransferase
VPPVATILVPTHNHAETLPFAVGSALAQTVEEIEVFIVGDGVDDRTREAARALSDVDARVRFVDRPKGPRHGEPYRHEILAGEAQGRLVAYLSDDDLWMPDHIATIRDVADATGADFIGALTLGRLGDGTWVKLNVDLAMEAHRELMAGGFNRVGLSSAAHTLDAYRRLPYGWRPAPDGTPTDLHMWQQWLAEPWPRYASARRPTVLNFPGAQRGDLSAEERAAEIERFLPALSDPLARLALLDQLIEDEAPRSAWLEGHYRALEAWAGARSEALEWHREKLEAVAVEHAALVARIAQLEADLTDATAENEACRGRLADAEAHVAMMLGSRRWRFGERIASAIRRA